MAVRRELSGGLPLVEDRRHSLLRIQSCDLARLEKHVYQRYPRREWGTFFEFGYRRTPWGLALSFVDGLWPRPGDLNRDVGITRFLAPYSRRALHHSAGSSLAIGVVHSHPQGCATYPSPTDDDMDDYFARQFAAYSDGKPYCSLVLQRDSHKAFTFTGRVFDRGEWFPVEKLFSVGEGIELFRSEADQSDSVEELLIADEGRARLISLLGMQSAVRLRNATVGIIGCSGTGSPAAHVLARAGVGNFVLVDPQRFDDSNLERLHGSVGEHLFALQKPYKVELVAALIRSINPNAHITTFAGNILHDNVFDELLRCDLLLGCTDTQHGRAKLSDTSHHYLLPSIDLGVSMDGENGSVESQVSDVTIYSPDLPCAFCAGRIDAVELNNELTSDYERIRRENEAIRARRRGDNAEQYWRQRTRQLHTIGYLTGMLGSLGAGYAEGILTGSFHPPHSWFQFDVGKECFGFAAPPRDRVVGCACGQHLGWADAAAPFRNVARPDHWSKRGLLLSRTDRIEDSQSQLNRCSDMYLAER